MKSEKEKVDDYVKQIRKTYPKQYNQILLLDYLTDPEVQLLVSITTRGDGKTYGYLLALIKLALKFKDFKFIFLTRHFTLRAMIESTIDQILRENFNYGRGDVHMDGNNHFTKITIKGEDICLLTELKAATDLKYSSTTLREFRFILYDEFIAAVDSDYLPEEAEQLKTIYESVARSSNNKLLPIPKIMLLGNPHNFNSPLFSYFDMYQILDKQKINTIEKHGNIVLERWRNEQSVKNVKSDLFGSSEDNQMYNGEFTTNEDLIASPSQLAYDKNLINIKLEYDQYLIIHFKNDEDFYLEITYKRPKKINYTMVLIGLTSGVKYLDEDYFSLDLIRDHEDGLIRYANTFTITQFDRNEQLKQLDYIELIEENMDCPKIKLSYKDDEKKLELQQERNVKRKLFEEYLK